MNVNKCKKGLQKEARIHRLIYLVPGSIPAGVFFYFFYADKIDSQ